MLGATLMITQSFLYNAIFFSYPGVLVTYYGVHQKDTAIYIIPFAVGTCSVPWSWVGFSTNWPAKDDLPQLLPRRKPSRS